MFAHHSSIDKLIHIEAMYLAFIIAHYINNACSYKHRNLYCEENDGLRTRALPRANIENYITVIECINNTLTDIRNRFILHNIEINISTIYGINVVYRTPSETYPYAKVKLWQNNRVYTGFRDTDFDIIFQYHSHYDRDMLDYKTLIQRNYISLGIDVSQRYTREMLLFYNSIFGYYSLYS